MTNDLDAVRAADEQRVRRQVAGLISTALGVDQIYTDTDGRVQNGTGTNITANETGQYAITGQPFSNLNATIGPNGVAVGMPLLLLLAGMAWLAVK